MRKSIRRAFFGLACLVCVSQVQAQEADDSTLTAARALGTAGVESYESGDFRKAKEKLEQAYGLVRVPSLGLWSARALVKVGLLLEAADRYLEVLALQVPSGDATVQRQAQLDARTELDILRPTIPRLSVRLIDAAPSDVEVSIDGKAVPSALLKSPRLVNPGRHLVEAQRGGERTSAEVTLVAGEEQVVEIRFREAAASAAGSEARPPAPSSAASVAPSTTRTVGWIALAGGGTALVFGTITGFLAVSKKSELEDTGKCVASRCPPSLVTQTDELDTFRMLSTVGFVAGAVLAGTGAVLLLTSKTSESSVSAWMAPTSAGLQGRF